MKILVTGGAGYIGSVVTAELIAAGNQVVVYDNLSTGAKRTMHENAELVVGELGDHEHLGNVIREHNVTGVMHFAASIEGGESMKVSGKYFRNNTANTLTLIQTMLECGVTKMVFFDSSVTCQSQADAKSRERCTGACECLWGVETAGRTDA